MERKEIISIYASYRVDEITNEKSVANWIVGKHDKIIKIEPYVYT